MSYLYLSNISLLFFNLSAFMVGTFFVIKNFEDLNTTNGIQDCSHIFILCCLGVVNNLIPLMGCFQFTEFSIIAFITSLSLSSYNTYNFTIINKNCSNYYYNQYPQIWYYYSISTAIQFMNIILYLIKCNISICNKKNNDSNPLQTQPLLQTQPNIYECDQNTITI